MATKGKPFVFRMGGLTDRLMKAMSSSNVWVYRATGGRLMGRFPGGGQPLLLLTTIGRKSGQPRTTPLIYLKDGADLVIVASKGGMDEHPLWYTNLVAQPDVEVEVGPRRLPMRAHTTSPEDRARLWPQLVALYPDYGVYQQRTDREIPVVVLSPRAP